MRWWRELKEEYDNEQNMQQHENTTTVPELELDTLGKHSLEVQELLDGYFEEHQFETWEYVFDEETHEYAPTGRRIMVTQKVPMRTKGIFGKMIAKGLMRGVSFQDGPGRAIKERTNKNGQ